MKTRVMVISDGLSTGTGFGEETRHIFYRLTQTGEFDISYLGLVYQGFPIKLPDSVFPDIPHKNSEILMLGGQGGDPHLFGADVFPKHYADYKPEIVFFMGDPRCISAYVNEPFFWKDKLHFPLFLYVTLDGLPIHPSWIPNLEKVNVLISMTEWAQLEYVKVGLSPAAIHHGVNWNWMSNDQKTKSLLRRKYHVPEETTLFINWDVPQHRKRIDALLRCWKAFKPETKNAKLLLYSDWNMDKSLGWGLEGLIKQYNVPRETILSPTDLTGKPKFWEVPERPETLREIARLGDIFVNTTSGEGFGKTGLEAMSLGMPVIITDYSACSEVHQKGSILIPITGTYRPDDRRRSVEAGLVNEEKFTEAMLYLYNNQKEREELGIQAREWAKEFDYDTKIIPQWLNLFHSVPSPETILMKELLQI